jgi:hypothetical protein
MPTTFFYSQPGCTGSVYIPKNAIPDWITTLGSVYRAADSPQESFHYLPRGSSYFSVTVHSHEDGSVSGCTDESVTADHYLLLPNDETTTGVPNVEPPRPYTLGVP